MTTSAAAEHGTYHYRITVTDRGNRVSVDLLRPDRSQVTLPRGVAQLDPLPDRIRDLVVKASRGNATADDFEELGEALFESLLPGDLAVNLRDVIDRAYRERAKVRIELDLHEAELPTVAALPWELLRAPQSAGRAADALGTNPNVALVRRRALWAEAEPITVREPLRILLVVSEPNDPDLGPVAFQEVEAALHKLAAELPDLIAPLPPVLRQPSLAILSDQIERERPHLLHVIGHGRMRRLRGVDFGELALVGTAGTADWCDDEQIGALFQVHRPAVVIFQACQSGTGSSSQALVGIASQVVQQNVPVVVAMQYPISNLSASIFAEEFYRRLSLRERVDVAAQFSRRRLRLEKADPRDVAAPVVFARVEDGRLFAADAPSNPGPAGSSTKEPQITTPTETRSRPDEGRIDRRALRDLLVNQFSQEELADLCLDIEETWRTEEIVEPLNLELVGGGGKTSKVLNLIGYLERRGRLGYLVEAVRNARPGSI